MSQAHKQRPQQDKSDNAQGSAFEMPQEYVHGRRRRLKEFHTGDWWLNVDYVEEIKLRSA